MWKIAVEVALVYTLLVGVGALVTIPLRRWRRVEGAPPLAPLWARLMLGAGVALGAYRIAAFAGWSYAAAAGALALASFGLAFVAELDRPRPRLRAVLLVGTAVFASAGAVLLFGVMQSTFAAFLSAAFAPIPPCLVRVRQQGRGLAVYGWLLTFFALGVGALAMQVLSAALTIPDDASAALFGLAATLGLHGCGLERGLAPRPTTTLARRAAIALLLLLGLVGAVLLSAPTLTVVVEGAVTHSGLVTIAGASAPRAGAIVRVATLGLPQSTSREGRTDAQGSCSFRWLPSGDYRVSVDAGDWFTDRAVGVVPFSASAGTRERIRLKGQLGITLTADVHDRAGAPLEGVEVDIAEEVLNHRRNWQEGERSDRWRVTRACSRTGRDGKVSLAMPRLGSHRWFRFRAPGGGVFDDWLDLAGDPVSLDVTLAGRALSVQSTALGGGHKLRVSAHGAPDDARSDIEARLWLKGADGRLEGGNEQIGSGSSSDGVRWFTREPTPGSYLITVEGSGVYGAADIEIPSGRPSVTHLAIDLAAKVHVHGVVREKGSGRALEGIRIDFVPQACKRHAPYTCDGAWFERRHDIPLPTDATGAFDVAVPSNAPARLRLFKVYAFESNATEWRGNLLAEQDIDPTKPDLGVIEVELRH